MPLFLDSFDSRTMSSESKSKATAGNNSHRELIRAPNIADHFHTNEPPDDGDAKIFYETLKYATNQEPLLLKEIHLLRAALCQRENELYHVQKAIREHKLVLSSLRRLPGELLMDIFFQVLGSQDSEDVLDFNRGLWPLTQVCTRWRSLILEHTSFWTTVSLPGRIHYPLYAIHILSLFLERSGSRPIFVNFTCRDVTSVTQTLFSVLVSQSSRWETCRLRIPVYLTNHLPPSAIERAQLFHHLDLNMDVAYSSRLIRACNNLFADAPALRSVKLVGVPLAPDTLGLRWSYLTHINVTQDFPEKLLPILRLTSGLVECTINCSRAWRQEPLGSDPVSLRKLQMLKLEGSASALLKYLVAPVLRSLRTVLSEMENSLKIFLSRSGYRLQELEIEAIPMGENIMDALQNTPNLTKLALNVSVRSGYERSMVLRDLLVALKYSSGVSMTECKLPRLEELILSVYATSSSECLYANELMAMVNSRWKVLGNIQGQTEEQKQKPARLRSFTLETNSDWLSDFDVLEELNREGLETNIHLH